VEERDADMTLTAASLRIGLFETDAILHFERVLLRGGAGRTGWTPRPSTWGR